jgi:DNA-binding LacI/PurR family transcriptional regulator
LIKRFIKTKMGPKMKRRPRQSDVAALAAVSPAIVSLVINDRADSNVRISPETRQRVWDAVRELGYVANPIARKLAGNQNRLLGVFTYEAIFPLEYRNFYYPFLLGIEEEVQAQDYDLVLFTRASGPDGRRSIYQDSINSLQITDGAILLGVHENRSELSRLVREGFPFVFIGRRELPDGAISYVTADYSEATRTIVEYMVRQGHQHIAYLRPPENREATLDREAGYRLAHQQLGMPLIEQHIFAGDAEEVTPQLIERFFAAGITAFLAENTPLVRRMLEIADQLGKSAPRDFSLALLGDHTEEINPVPDITTFLIPRKEMGKEAVRLLVDLLAHPDEHEARQIALPCTFVAGQTVAAPFHAE